jgi:CrcB protein
MLPYLWVALGGALGSVGRYWLSLVGVRMWGEYFPWATLLINVIGSFVIGAFGTLTSHNGAMPAPNDVRVFVMVGICGGFTTFSSFSLQTLLLLRGGAVFSAISNVVLSVALCLLAVAIGHYAAARLAPG